MAILFDLISTNVSVEKLVSDQLLHRVWGLQTPLRPRVQREGFISLFFIVFGFYLICLSIVYLSSIYLSSIIYHLSVIHRSVYHLSTSMSVIYQYLSIYNLSSIYHLSSVTYHPPFIFYLYISPSMRLSFIRLLSVICIYSASVHRPSRTYRLVHPSVYPSSSPPPFSVNPGPMGRSIK